MWVKIFKHYWRLTCFKEAPQDLPYSPLLLIMVAFLFWFVILLQWSITDSKPLTGIFMLGLVGISLLLTYGIYTFIILKLANHKLRLVQTLSALFACHGIIHCLAFPLLFFGLVFLDNDQALALLIGIVYLLLTLALALWQFMITVHIYKHALGSNYLTAVFASIGLLASSILTISLW